VDASDDPMIRLVRLVRSRRRARPQDFRGEVDAPEGKNSELVAAGPLRRGRTSTYPTPPSPRASPTAPSEMGRGRKTVPPFTDDRGTLRTSHREDPFALPKSWIEKKKELKWRHR